MFPVAKRLLAFFTLALLLAFVLVNALDALDASKPVAQTAAILFSGIGGGIGAALFTPRKHVE